jgi:hypothetical protein
MTNAREKMRRGENPFVATRLREWDGALEPVYELKFGLVFYLDRPPGPKRSRAVFDAYFSRFGGQIKRWASTAPGEAELYDWTSGSEQMFKTQLLPGIRSGIHWGYAFDDGAELDGNLFMLHGYRPASEPGRASFFRFEFPWNVSHDAVRELAAAVADAVPFVSAVGGYFFKPTLDEPDAYDEMYGICQRYWGVDAWNLDMMVYYVRDAYPSVNWLTLIGSTLQAREPDAIDAARRGAWATQDLTHGVLLQAAESPTLGDRNAADPMPGYFALASALEPLQLIELESFGGRRWDDSNSLEWVQRFTSASGTAGQTVFEA